MRRGWEGKGDGVGDLDGLRVLRTAEIASGEVGNGNGDEQFEEERVWLTILNREEVWG